MTDTGAIKVAKSAEDAKAFKEEQKTLIAAAIDEAECYLFISMTRSDRVAFLANGGLIHMLNLLPELNVALDQYMQAVLGPRSAPPNEKQH